MNEQPMAITYQAIVWNEFGMSAEREFATYAEARKAIRHALRAEIWRFNTAGDAAKIWPKPRKAR